jgi:hypothetical protein
MYVSVEGYVRSLLEEKGSHERSDEFGRGFLPGCFLSLVWQERSLTLALEIQILS